jgi:hypothetical protein
MEFSSASKKNEILSSGSKWMELENITLSEVSRLRGQKLYVLPYVQITDLKQMQ